MGIIKRITIVALALGAIGACQRAPQGAVSESTPAATIYRNPAASTPSPVYIAERQEFCRQSSRMGLLLHNGFMVAVPSRNHDIASVTEALLERDDVDSKSIVVSGYAPEGFDYAAAVIWDEAPLKDTLSDRQPCPHLFMKGGPMAGYFVQKGWPSAQVDGLDSPEILADLLLRLAVQKHPLLINSKVTPISGRPAKRVRYARHGVSKETYTFAVKDVDTLKMDVYRPEGLKGPLPVVQYTFGGGWQGGKRSDMDSPLYPFCTPMAELGYIVVAADYRLGFKKAEARGEVPRGNLGLFLLELKGEEKNAIVEVCRKACIDAVEDLYDATSFIVAHAREWGADPSKIVLAGGSAGACNSIMAEYLRANGDEMAKAHLPEGFRYAGVIPCAGALFSRADEPVEWKSAPAPFLFFHGAEDPLIPYEASAGMKGPQALIPTLPSETPYVMYSMTGINHDASSIPTSYMNHAIAAFINTYVDGNCKDRVYVEETLLGPGSLFERYLRFGNPYPFEQILESAMKIWASYDE